MTDTFFTQWNNGRIIALLVLAVVLLIGFCLVQVFMPKTATVPTRFFKQRSILAGVWSTFVLGSAMMIFGMSILPRVFFLITLLPRIHPCTNHYF